LALSGDVMGEEPKPAQSAPVAGKTTLGLAVAESQLVTTGWRVSRLVGADVRNDANERIGKVDDIIVSANGTLSARSFRSVGSSGSGAA
jgi:hypothetical protein